MYTAAANTELVVGEGKAVAHAFLAELRVTVTTGKQVPERLARLDNRHLWRVHGDLEHPWELLALDGIELASQGSLRGLGLAIVGLPCLVLMLPLRQCPVIKQTGLYPPLVPCTSPARCSNPARFCGQST